ncbi:MAG: DUF2490 domain-containing protein [Candidatus Loosdrechtia sp.]|uniref:DUF2490 domain-containing protein n=1 Tax=Candidatus Loosdrechtia sp. TaxID=3101272 RepID=UPI00403AFED5
MKWFKTFFCFLVFVLIQILPSQWTLGRTASDYQIWNLLYFQRSITGNFSGYFELQPRFGDNASEPDRLLIRPALVYHLNERNSFWVGYLAMPVFQGNKGTEHRYWSQFLYQRKSANLEFSSRSRLELRDIPDVKDWAVRFRQMGRLAGPISHDKTFYWALWNEVLVNLNSTSGGPQAGYDQNRFFLGIGRKLRNAISVELGYLMNHINIPANTSDRINHAAFLMIGINNNHHRSTRKKRETN